MRTRTSGLSSVIASIAPMGGLVAILQAGPKRFLFVSWSQTGADFRRAGTLADPPNVRCPVHRVPCTISQR